MAGLDLSQPLLGAGASAKCDFAAAQARTGLDFDLDLQFKRGAKLEIGLGAYADASAELSKFIRASIEGTAFAEARAGVQLQLPLNLFDEFGFSARAEAIAQAAAGLEANLGLSIGDFVALAKRDPELIGVPLEVFMLFLEEVSIGGAFEVNVSASAKAHASISVAGIIIEKAGEKAGFYVTAAAGAGLAAGVGMGIKAGFEFKDFRRFFGRAVDISVDKTISDIFQLLPAGLKLQSSGDDLNPWLQVFSPVAKTCLRIAYDVGLKLSQNNPGSTQNDMASLCNEAIKTFLEEAQRFLFGKLLESGATELKNLFEQQANQMGPAGWDALLPQRNALSDHLLTTPNEPFQNTAENIQYWKDLVIKTLALINAIANPDPKFTRSVSVFYACSELMLEAVRAKVNTASTYAGAVGAGTVNADTQPFRGALQNQPDAAIKIAIAGANRALTYADLIAFLLSNAVVDPALNAFPELKNFVDIFGGHFQQTGKEVLGLLLKNAASFDLTSPANAQSDPQILLSKIVLAIDDYITGRFRAEVLPVVLEHITDPMLRLYVQEVLFEAVVYMKDVGLKSLLAWSDPARSFDNDDFTEALAGVMMLLLGRTVVITADTLMNAMQEQAAHACNTVADKIKTRHADIQRFEIPNELLKIAEDCVRVGGEVLEPLPPTTHARVRRLLYQVFEPIPPGQEQSFLGELADDFFIPNEADLRLLTDELTNIAKERFVLFAQKFIGRVGNYILGLLEESILQVIDMVLNWERSLATALNKLAQLLRQLEDRITEVNQDVIDLFVLARNALHSLLQTLSGSELQSKIKTEIKSKFVDKALDELEDNEVYKGLPSNIKTSVRELVGGAVNVAMNNPVINPVFAAVNAVAGQLDALLPDVRELDPEENLPEQLMDLILDKIEQNIRNQFDGGKPGISLTLDYSFSIWVPDDIFGNGHWETKHIYVSLGRVEINLNPLIAAVRAAINALDFYHDALDNACFKLADALAAELELAATILERDKKKQRKDRMERLLNEHNNDPKEIAILSPVNLEHYTNTIECKIHLGGVPISYLGLGKSEASRVLIYVNSHLVPVKSLVVEEGLSVKDANKHKEDIDWTNIKAVGSFKNNKLNVLTDTSATNPAQIGNKQKSQAKKFSFSNSAIKEEAVSKSVYSAGVKTGASKVQLNRVITKDGKGRLVNNYQLDNLRPGGLKPASNLQEMLNGRLPGILLQFKVELDEPFVVEGVNIVTVVVIEKGGSRHQQSVHFTVGKPVVGKPGRPRLELPGFIDPKKKFSINNVFRAKIASAGAGTSKNIKDEMEKRVGKARKEAAVKPGVAVKVDKPAVTKAVKKETITIRDKNGKELARHELDYGTLAERAKKLAALKIDLRKLAKEGKRIQTEKVIYEKIKVPAVAKKFDVKPLLNLTEAGIRDEMKAAVSYLDEQNKLNLKKLEPDN